MNTRKLWNKRFWPRTLREHGWGSWPNRSPSPHLIPPQSSEWGSQGGHFSSQLQVGCFAASCTLSPEQRHSRPRGAGLSPPAGSSRAHPPVGQTSPQHPGLSTEGAATVHLIPPKGRMRSRGSPSPLSHPLRLPFLSLLQRQV